MVFVTHDQAEAMTLSDRVAVFNHGRVVQLATPQQLYDAPADVFVAGFIGDNNHLAGQADGQGGLHTANGLRLQGRPAAGAVSGRSAAGAVSGRATLCVRPEHLRPARDGDSLNRLDATVLDAIHLGDHWRLVFRIGGAGSTAGAANGDADDHADDTTTWFAKLAPGALPAGLAPGQHLPMAFDPQHAWLFAA